MKVLVTRAEGDAEKLAAPNFKRNAFQGLLSFK